MEKQLKTDCMSFDVTNGITIEEFNDKYLKILKEVKDKYGYITDIKIRSNSGEYTNGENYYEEIDIYYKRYETDDEFEKRKKRIEHSKVEQKRIEIEKMKEYIQSYKNEALEFINNLSKN